MNYNEIDEILRSLAKLSMFLGKLKNEQIELSKTKRLEKTVKNTLDGFSFSETEFSEFEKIDERRRRALFEALQPNISKNIEDGAKGIINFNEKEINSMPKTFKRIFILQNKRCRLRTKATGKNSVTYEIRFRREGYNISASGKTIELAKKAFLEKLKTAKPITQSKSEIPKTFSEFTRFYFENFRKEKVCAETLKADLNRFKNYLQPSFKEMPLDSITPYHCKKLLNDVSATGKLKTVDELYSNLNCIFKSAIAHSIIDKNPLATVMHVQHERVSGSALTPEEEITLKNSKSKYLPAFMMALYTGARPNELYTAHVDGQFIVMQNSKQKNKKIRYKKIPILNQLKPYLSEALNLPAYEEVRKEFKKILPGHKIYDLRTTFYSKCVEFNVSETARKLFMGHSLGKLPTAYTDVSDNFLLKEAKKLENW